MKLRTFRIILSRGWRNVMYSVSFFVFSMLSVYSNAQTVSDTAGIGNSRSKIVVSGPKPAAGDTITGRVTNSDGAYGPQYPQDANPLIVLNGNLMDLDFDKLNDFDFTNDSFSKEKVAALLDLKADQIISISILTGKAATKKWGGRAANGVLEVTSK